MAVFKVLSILTITIVFVLSGNATKLPSSLKPCSASDPNLNSCAKSAASQLLPQLAKGFPDLKVQSFEPLDIGNIVDEMNGLKFSFNNSLISFITTKTKIDEIKIDQNRKRMKLTFTSDADMRADYKLSGRLLVLPVTGEGKCLIKTEQITYIFKMYYDVEKGKDGKDHWIFKRHKVTFSPTRVTLKFENLFNGNKQLADAIHIFANENWKEVFLEVGTPLMIKLTNVIAENIKHFFANVPVEDFLTK